MCNSMTTACFPVPLDGHATVPSKGFAYDSEETHLVDEARVAMRKFDFRVTIQILIKYCVSGNRWYICYTNDGTRCPRLRQEL